MPESKEPLTGDEPVSLEQHVEEAIEAACRDCVCNACRERLQMTYVDSIRSERKRVWEKATSLVRHIYGGGSFGKGVDAAHDALLKAMEDDMK